MTITGRPDTKVADQRTRSARDREAVLRVGWLTLRAEWRARRAAWLALALVVGLAGGVVLTAAAGAQRTGTAFARLLQASHAADVSVTVNGNGQAYDRALARLPGVSGLARVLLNEVGYFSLVLPGGGRVAPIGADISADGRWGTSIDRARAASCACSWSSPAPGTGRPSGPSCRSGWRAWSCSATRSSPCPPVTSTRRWR